MFKIGNLVINEQAIAYVDLDAKRNYVTDRESTLGVRIYFKVSDSQGTLASLFFADKQADMLRKYFESSAVELKDLIHE